MYDQNDQQGQMGQPQDNNPYGQLPSNDNQVNNNDGSLGVAHDQNVQNDSTLPQQDNNQSFSTNDENSNGNDLLDIKQDALQQLSPLVAHLEQTPEEKFKTTMMMIQASDDQSLIKIAYDTAKQIGDEKARAQALLDVVNEINYFTQQNKN